MLRSRAFYESFEMKSHAGSHTSEKAICRFVSPIAHTRFKTSCLLSALSLLDPDPANRDTLLIALMNDLRARLNLPLKESSSKSSTYPAVDLPFVESSLLATD